MKKLGKYWLYAAGVAALILFVVLLAPDRFDADAVSPDQVQQEAKVVVGNPFNPGRVQRLDDSSGYIAHAMGVIDGERYTNSPEAFRYNYDKGLRIFEVDFLLLGDGTVIAGHNDHETDYGLPIHFSKATYEDVRGLKYKGRYSVMTSKDFIELMRAYPEASFVIDTKPLLTLGEHIQILQKLVEDAGYDASLLDRMIPHVSDAENLRAVRAVYPFRYTMLALYRMLSERPLNDQQIIDYIKQENISAVMSWRGLRHPGLDNGANNGLGTVYSPEFSEALAAAGIPYYVHGFPLGAADEIKVFREQGIGVYAEDISFIE